MFTQLDNFNGLIVEHVFLTVHDFRNIQWKNMQQVCKNEVFSRVRRQSFSTY
jgi:hypothetical protein